MSRVRSLRPSRESTVLSRIRVFVSHQKRSRPSNALRQGLLPRADREHDLVRRRQLLRDLKASVAAADDEDDAVRHVVRPSIAHGVRLEDTVSELLGELRHVRQLEGPGRHHDLVGGHRSPVHLEPEAFVVAALEARDLGVQLDRQLESLGVVLEIRGHLVSGRVAVGLAGEREPRHRAVPPGSEERERLPALPPRRPDRFGALDDGEPTSLAARGSAPSRALPGRPRSRRPPPRRTPRTLRLARRSNHPSRFRFPPSRSPNLLTDGTAQARATGRAARRVLTSDRSV